MAFVKVIKNRSYFIRYQVKYRRRREGKTDYQARRRLVQQDKNKYNTPKYRLVVRFTNKDVICQVVRAKIEGDYVLAAAYGHELKRYGIPVGHSNYASAYAVGLLVARRILSKFNLADKYAGQVTATGDDFNVKPMDDGPRPLKVILDTGLKRTSTGSRVFAALKGACDGGVNIPHSVTRYVGYDSEAKKLKADVLRKHIFGVHVAEHMRSLKDEDSAAFEKKFSRYIKNKIGADDVEKMYTKAHAAIRADPLHKPKEAPKPKEGESWKDLRKRLATHKRYHQQKLTRTQRRGKVNARKVLSEKKKAKAAAAGSDDE